MKEKIFINKTGGCICGDITFNVKLDEVPLVYNCHHSSYFFSTINAMTIEN